MSKAVNFEVKPRNNEDQMRMIRRFVKKTKKEGLIDKVRRRSQYTSKSEIRKLNKERK